MSIEPKMSHHNNGTAETEPFVSIEFSFQTSANSTISIHKAKCGTEIPISGLKMDFKNMFGNPENQEWYHRTTKLADNKTLSHYGITSRHGHTFKIYVKQINPET